MELCFGLLVNNTAESLVFIEADCCIGACILFDHRVLGLLTHKNLSPI